MSNETSTAARADTEINQEREKEAARARLRARKAHATAFVRAMSEPGDCREVRCLSVGGRDNRKDAGWSSDVVTLAEMSVDADCLRKPRGVYITLNPCDPALEARALNRIAEWQKEMTADRDILRRRWLLIDIDPVRPSGIMANDSEREAAAAVTESVREWLMSDHGWGEPVVIDSGNGRYLLWPIDLPNDDESRELVSQTLKAIAQRFDTSQAKIDTTVSNASRILRIPGTTNRKGDNAGAIGRPWRIASLIFVPDYLQHGWAEPVSVERLRAVADLAADQHRGPAASGTEGQSKLRSRLESTSVIDRARKYLATIAPAVSGQRGHTQTLLASEHLVRGFDLSDADAFALLTDWNQYCVPPWADNELRHKISEARSKGTAVAIGQHLKDDPTTHPVRTDSRPARRNEPALMRQMNPGEVVRALDKNNYGKVVKDNGASCSVKFTSLDGVSSVVDLPKDQLVSVAGAPTAGRNSEPAFTLSPMTLSEFMATSFPQHYLVSDILIAGQLAVIGAPKKTLKTSICCDLAFSLTTGTPFLGRFSVPAPVNVLLLSAESGPAKLQRSFSQIAHARQLRPESDRLVIEHEAVPQLACQEHLRVLSEKIRELQTKVVILDPLYLMLLGGSDRPINPSDMFQMGMLLKAVDDAVREADATLILVHHSTKAAGRKFEPLDLDDLSQAGIAAFARQWILLSPRRKFDTSTGTHELFFEVGGSAGHFGSYVMTVIEGRADSFQGKKWDVAIKDAGDARERDRQEKEHRDEVEAHNRVMGDVERMAEILRKLPDGEGLTKSRLELPTGWNSKRISAAVALAYEKKIIEDCKVRAGNGRDYDGFRLVSGPTC